MGRCVAPRRVVRIGSLGKPNYGALAQRLDTEAGEPGQHQGPQGVLGHRARVRFAQSAVARRALRAFHDLAPGILSQLQPTSGLSW